MDLRTRGLPRGWYPGSEADVKSEIQSFSSYMERYQAEAGPVRGGIVPHAGWYFSGRLAALVFHLAAQGAKPDVTAVFGGHLGPGRGVIYDDRAWSTPLGDLVVDRELTEALKNDLGLRPEGSSTNDNTVEIQLPLVKYYFPESRLLALRAPHSEQAIEIGRQTARLAAEQGKSILVFGSTDLTHYGPNYAFTPKGTGSSALEWVKEENDKVFIDLALSMDDAGLLDHAVRNHSACSAGAAAAASAACRELGAKEGQLVDYYTSHDVMPGDSFVGYAGIVY